MPAGIANAKAHSYPLESVNGYRYEKCKNSTGGSLAAGTPVFVEESGADGDRRMIALVDDAQYHNLGVVDDKRHACVGDPAPWGAVANGDYGFVCVAGPRIDVTTAALAVTATHAGKVHNGAIGTMAAAQTGDPSECLVFEDTAGGGGATTHTVRLIGREALSTT